jgi:hypothetical protein
MAQIAFTAGSNWPTANKAFYQHIIIKKPFLLASLWWVNGTAASGNVDTGIYDADTLKLLASTGSTARSGTNSLQVVAVGPLLLKPGDYLLGHVSDTTSNSRSLTQTINSQLNCDLMGVTQELSAFPLPSTATPTQTSTNFMAPHVGGYSTLYGG